MRIDPTYQAAIARHFDDCAITYTLVMGGKHPRLEFVVDGRAHRLTLPGSPSDQRGVKNLIADLRRLTGRKTSTPVPETLPPADLLATIRARLAAMPPTAPTDRDHQALALLDDELRSAVAIGTRAGKSTAWVVERLERLVALGLADADGVGRYRRR